MILMLAKVGETSLHCHLARIIQRVYNQLMSDRMAIQPCNFMISHKVFGLHYLLFGNEEPTLRPDPWAILNYVKELKHISAVVNPDTQNS